MIEFAARSGANARQREDIALAVSEALSNSVLHAYVGHGGPGAVEVVATATKSELRVVVSDEGNGLVARADSPGLGLGLSLIDLVAEHLELIDAAPGLRVQMTFPIG